jgi:DNA-binding response OmpR family regulator
MAAGTRPTVLLVDDEPDLLELMECALAQEGFALITCRSPEDGLRRLAAGDVRCVLLNVAFGRTPECLGFLSALRALQGDAAPPILVTSATAGPELVRQVLDLGARKFIPRPFYPRDIRRAVRSLVA